MTDVVDARGDLDAAVHRAVTSLMAGGVVLVPTDTVYGIAARVEYPGAISRLFAMKARPVGMPIAVLVTGIDQAADLGRLSTHDRAAAAAFWPGPLTIVLDAHPSMVENQVVGVDGTIGIRCPHEVVVRRVAARVGPLATTSANLHGGSTPTTAHDAAASLAGPVDLVVDGGPRSGAPSTVATVGPPLVVHRAGALSEAALRARLHS